MQQQESWPYPTRRFAKIETEPWEIRTTVTCPAKDAASFSVSS